MGKQAKRAREENGKAVAKARSARDEYNEIRSEYIANMCKLTGMSSFDLANINPEDDVMKSVKSGVSVMRANYNLLAQEFSKLRLDYDALVHANQQQQIAHAAELEQAEQRINFLELSCHRLENKLESNAHLAEKAQEAVCFICLESGGNIDLGYGQRVDLRFSKATVSCCGNSAHLKCLHKHLFKRNEDPQLAYPLTGLERGCPCCRNILIRKELVEQMPEDMDLSHVADQLEVNECRQALYMRAGGDRYTLAPTIAQAALAQQQLILAQQPPPPPQPAPASDSVRFVYEVGPDGLVLQPIGAPAVDEGDSPPALEAAEEELDGDADMALAVHAAEVAQAAEALVGEAFDEAEALMAESESESSDDETDPPYTPSRPRARLAPAAPQRAPPPMALPLPLPRPARRRV
jgi:hypothetical protein